MLVWVGVVNLMYVCAQVGVCSQLGARLCSYICVSKVNNLGDEFREAFSIDCQCVRGHIKY